MASKVRMTEGPIGRAMLSFSIPLIFSNLLQVLFNMSDLAVVGNFAGPEALGAVGSTTMIVCLYTFFIIGLASGINALMARFIGAGRQTDVTDTLHTGFLLMILMGLTMMVLGLVTSGPLLRLLSTREDLYDQALLYLRLYALGYPAMAVYNHGHAVYSAMGNTRKPLIYLALAGLLNVALNLFFVIVCRMDVAGVAVASALSQCLAAALMLISLKKEKGDFHLSFAHVRLIKAKASAILRLGLPAGFQNSIFMIANMFVQSAVNSFPTVIVMGNSAASNADNLNYEVISAFYVAGTSFIGQNYGAGKKDRILKSYFWSLGLATAVSCFISLMLGLFGHQFLSLFTSDREVIEAGMLKLGIMVFSYPLACFMDATTSASRGLGRTFVPTFILILGSCVFRIIWVYAIFPLFGTIPSLYLLYMFSWIISSVAEILYFVHIYRTDPILKKA